MPVSSSYTASAYGFRFGAVAQEVERGARREAGGIGLHVESDVFPLSRQSQDRGRTPHPATGEDVLVRGARTAHALCHELGRSPFPAWPGRVTALRPLEPPRDVSADSVPAKSRRTTRRRDRTSPLPSQRSGKKSTSPSWSLPGTSPPGEAPTPTGKLRRKPAPPGASPRKAEPFRSRPPRSRVRPAPWGAAQGSGARPMPSRMPGRTLLPAVASTRARRLGRSGLPLARARKAGYGHPHPPLARGHRHEARGQQFQENVARVPLDLPQDDARRIPVGGLAPTTTRLRARRRGHGAVPLRPPRRLHVLELVVVRPPVHEARVAVRVAPARGG